MSDKVQSIPSKVRVSFGPEWKFTQVNGHCVAEVPTHVAGALVSRLGGLLCMTSSYEAEITKIIRIVAEAHGLDYLRLLQKSRPEHISFPRQIAMYLSREMTDAPFKEIARVFRKDHGTIMHGCRVVSDRAGVNDRVKRLIKELRTKITDSRTGK